MQKNPVKVFTSNYKYNIAVMCFLWKEYFQQLSIKMFVDEKSKWRTFNVLETLKEQLGHCDYASKRFNEIWIDFVILFEWILANPWKLL